MEKNYKVGIIRYGDSRTEQHQLYKTMREHILFEALSDLEKQKPMQVQVTVKSRGRLVSLCPRCNHCLVGKPLICDECFQRLKWE